MKRFSELLAGLEIREHSGEVEVHRLCCDSREAQPGDLFIALRGLTHDAHQFLPEAQARGAVAFLVERRESLPPPATVWAVVPDTREALWQLAQRFYDDPSAELITIGVTGTNGKTTTTHLIRSIMETAGYPTALIGTLGFYLPSEGRTQEGSLAFTTPEPPQLQALLAQALANGARAAVMEVSSHALTWRRADGVHFDVGVLTNLTQDHLDFHATMEAYAQAKLRLFTELAERSGKPFRAVLNLETEWGNWFAQRAFGQVLTYGVGEEAQVRAVEVHLAVDGTSFEVVSSIPPYRRFPVALQLSAPFNLMNALAAIATALSLGIPIEAIQEGLRKVEGIAGRFERVPTGRDFHLIVDYAHTPDALQRLLEAARALKPRRLVVLFGCGGDRDPGKRPKMGRIAVELADRVLVTSDNPRTEDPDQIIQQILAGIPPEGQNKVVVQPDRREAIRLAIQTAQPGDLIVLAGKGHEAYQIIGRERFPFDDRVVARECLDSLEK